MIEPHFILKGERQTVYRGLSQKSLPITISQKMSAWLSNDHVPVRIAAAGVHWTPFFGVERIASAS